MSAIKKKGLGRGLEALLGANDKPATSNHGVAMLKLGQLQAGKYQPRKNMVDGPLQELAQSIKEQGVMQPLLVRRLPTVSMKSLLVSVALEQPVWRA